MRKILRAQAHPSGSAQGLRPRVPDQLASLACPGTHKRREREVTNNYGSAKLHLGSVGHRPANRSRGRGSFWSLLSTEHTYLGSSHHSISSRLQGLPRTVQECWGGIWRRDAASTGLYEAIWSVLWRSEKGSWFKYLIQYFHEVAFQRFWFIYTCHDFIHV